MTHFSRTANPAIQGETRNPTGVVLVAGGGGGADDRWPSESMGFDNGSGGYGGGLVAGGAYLDGNERTDTAGTQSTGYSMGNGQSAKSFSGYTGGGGGGYWGGKSTMNNNGGGGGSGHVGDNMVSGETIGGDQTFKAPDGTDETGHSGDGYARVTLILKPTTSTDFDYTGDVQTFTAPKSGTYLLEAWGASGGCYTVDAERTKGGLGGYSYGLVELSQGQTLFVAIGSEGESVSSKSWGVYGSGGFNGGGNSASNGVTAWGAGGGATHFAINNNLGELKNYSLSQNDILLVAGGGGGGGNYSSYYHVGGYGGGESGGNGISENYSYGRGGTQNEGGVGYCGANATVASSNYTESTGSFGQGGTYRNGYNCSGGGGGWYGGGSGYYQGGSAGGGSGHVGSAMITGETIGGNQTFVSPNGTTETGHTGNGFAKITYLG